MLKIDMKTVSSWMAARSARRGRGGLIAMKLQFRSELPNGLDRYLTSELK